MIWPFSRPNYSKGAADVDAAVIQELFRAKTGYVPERLDNRVLVLEEQLMRDLVWDAIDNSWMKYGSNSQPEDPDAFPDCDDFCEVARAQVILGAIKAGLRRMAVFGRTEYESAQGSHRKNWGAVLRKGSITLLLFEPQCWKWSDDWSEVRRVIWSEF